MSIEAIKNTAITAPTAAAERTDLGKTAQSDFAKQVPGTTTTQPHGQDVFSQMPHLYEQMRQVTDKMDVLNRRVESGELKLGTPEYEHESRSLQAELMKLQISAQNVSLGAELMSKVVEHATSSTRSVLQTQT